MIECSVKSNGKYSKIFNELVHLSPKINALILSYCTAKFLMEQLNPFEDIRSLQTTVVRLAREKKKKRKKATYYN